MPNTYSRTQHKEALAYNNPDAHVAAPERSKGQCEDSSMRVLNKEDGALSSTSSALAWFSAHCSASTLPTVPHHYEETLQLILYYIYNCHCSVLLSLVNNPCVRAPQQFFLPLLSLQSSIQYRAPSLLPSSTPTSYGQCWCSSPVFHNWCIH